MEPSVQNPTWYSLLYDGNRYLDPDRGKVSSPGSRLLPNTPAGPLEIQLVAASPSGFWVGVWGLGGFGEFGIDVSRLAI